jgi:hypothetical protein
MLREKLRRNFSWSGFFSIPVKYVLYLIHSNLGSSSASQSFELDDGMGRPWNGTFVNNSGTLVEDLLANYLLEIGARNHKMRVYEMTTHPTALEMFEAERTLLPMRKQSK